MATTQPPQPVDAGIELEIGGVNRASWPNRDERQLKKLGGGGGPGDIATEQARLDGPGGY